MGVNTYGSGAKNAILVDQVHFFFFWGGGEFKGPLSYESCFGHFLALPGIHTMVTAR